MQEKIWLKTDRAETQVPHAIFISDINGTFRINCELRTDPVTGTGYVCVNDMGHQENKSQVLFRKVFVDDGLCGYDLVKAVDGLRPECGWDCGRCSLPEIYIEKASTEAN